MLSRKTQYAIKALSYLATNVKDGPILIAEIAEQKRIPIKFLEGILLQLRKANFLESKKGKGGGYFLAKDPNKISIASIIRELDGPISLLPCVSLYYYEKCTDCVERKCKINKVFAEARDATLAVLEARTLADFI